MDVPGFFGRGRPALMKIYELLRATEHPGPRTRLVLTARMNQNNQIDDTIWFWMLEQGFLEEVSYSEVAGRSAGTQRKPRRNVKGFYRTSVKGRDLQRRYEALFDILGISDQVQARFSE